MNKSRANLARIAERAGAIRSTAPTGTVGTNPALRSEAPSHPMAAGALRRTRCAPMTGAQRNSLGKRSEWAASPDYFTDPAWAFTVSDGRKPRDVK